MAADGMNELKFQLIHGTKKYEVVLELPSEEAGEVLNVSHLMDKVAQTTGIPNRNQRLIVKGRSLTDPDASLSSFGLKNDCKIMLLGRKHNEEDEGLMKKITTVETSVNKTDQKLSEVIHEVDGIHRGFLAEELKEEALKKLGKRIAGCIEDFTRQLEHLDAISLTDTQQEIRGQRKRLVNRIQELLVRCDSITTGVEEMLKQMKISARR